MHKRTKSPNNNQTRIIQIENAKRRSNSSVNEVFLWTVAINIVNCRCSTHARWGVIVRVCVWGRQFSNPSLRLLVARSLWPLTYSIALHFHHFSHIRQPSIWYTMIIIDWPWSILKNLDCLCTANNRAINTTATFICYARSRCICKLTERAAKTQKTPTAARSQWRYRILFIGKCKWWKSSPTTWNLLLLEMGCK